MIEQWEQVMKTLGQSTRLKILMLLASREHCVCELERIIDVSQPAISQHMRVLKAAGLVRERRDGQWIYYRLEKASLSEALHSFLSAMDSPRETVTEMKMEWERQTEIDLDPMVPCRTNCALGKGGE